MQRKILLLLALLPLLGLQAVLAQVQITGRVTDAQSGEGLPGANVIVVELNTGAITDVDGNYRIPNVAPGNYNVRASYVGYETQTRRVTVARENVRMDFQLRTDLQMLDELVVTGYGVQQKRDELAAVTRVDGARINQLPVVNAAQAIQGRAAGVAVQANSGQPGAGPRVQIRGVGSINAGSEPLYIVDGVQIETRDGALSSQAASSPLNAIAPHDIESIEILKDAAATAIYGAQAANGVVLITTRRGRAGPTRFELSTQIGAVEEIGRYDVLNGPEFIRAYQDAYGNHYRNLGFTAAQNNAWFGTNAVIHPGTEEAYQRGRQRALQSLCFAPCTPDNIDATPTYNWQDAIYRVGNQRRVDLAASGGTQETRFRLSGSYDLSEGQLIRSEAESFRLLANINHRVNRRMSLDASLRGSTVGQFGAIADGNWINGPFFAAPWMDPTIPFRNEDGTWYYPIPLLGYNILHNLLSEERVARTNTFAGNLGTSYQLGAGLFLRAKGGLSYQNVRDMNYRPREVPQYASYGGQLFEANRDVLTYNADVTTSWFRRFADVHNIDALAGAEYRFSNWEQFSATGRNFPSGLFRTMNLAATPFGVSGSYTEYKMASLFSQVRYDFDGRYLLSASLRYDGSSRFGADTKYGLFYSGSFGWEMTREAFLRDNPIVSLLRPRISYGVTGNSQIADFAARSLFGSGGSYNEAPAIRPTQLGNAILTWEEAHTLNLGLDYGFFNNRIFGSIEAYQRRNNELLLARQLPLDSGFASINENVGVVQNRGLEFEVTTINLDIGQFRWQTDFNISFLQNEVISLNEGQTEIGDIAIGRPLGSYRVYNYAGVNPADGRSMWYDRNGNITYNPVADDRIWKGNIYPDYWGGLGNTFSYGGLSLSTFFQFNIGQETFLQQQAFFLRDPSYILNLERIAWDRAWNQPGDITDTPKLILARAEPGIGSNITSSNRFIEDVSYVRLKNVQLSYAIPPRFVRQAGFQGANLFVQGQNLMTWTAFTGIDPEMWGTQNAIYPQNKVYTMGLTVQF